LAFRSSPESSSSAAARQPRSQSDFLPCGSFPLRRLPSVGQPLTPQGYHPLRSRCLLGVSHALKAFIRPTPAGPISDRSRPWGSLPLEDHSPLAEPHALSGTVALMWLARRLLLLCFPASSSPRPKELFLGCSIKQLLLGSPHFRAFLSARVRLACQWFRPDRQAQPSFGFLPRGFSLSAGGPS